MVESQVITQHRHIDAWWMALVQSLKWHNLSILFSETWQQVRNSTSKSWLKTQSRHRRCDSY